MTKRQIIGSIMAVTGQSVAMLAAEHNYTKNAFYDVIRGLTRTKHLRALIASIIGRPEEGVWPESHSPFEHQRPGRPPAEKMPVLPNVATQS